MKIHIILFVGLLSEVSLPAMEDSRSLKERFIPQGRIADVQQRIKDLQQELGIVPTNDDVKKNKSEREMNQELFQLVCRENIRKLKNATQQDIESLQVLPRPPHVAK